MALCINTVSWSQGKKEGRKQRVLIMLDVSCVEKSREMIDFGSRCNRRAKPGYMGWELKGHSDGSEGLAPPV